MATVEWVKLGTKNCQFVGHEVELMEKRAYPSGILNTGPSSYRVLSRKCSAGYECSHVEDPCVWADSRADGRLYNR